MPEVFIISAARTPLGQGEILAAEPDEPPFVQTELSYTVLQAAMQRLGVDRSRLETVIWGDPDGISLHNALIHSGMPALSPGILVGGGPLAGQQAIHFAAQAILAGDLDLALAGAVTAFPVTQNGLCFDPILRPLAERWALDWSLDRDELDALASRPNDRLASTAETKPTASLVQVGELLDRDQPQQALSIETLRTLAPQSPLTEAHFPACGCAAAAVSLASIRAVEQDALAPRACLDARSLVSLGRDQAWAGILPATQHALHRARLELSDIDLFQVSADFLGVEAVWAREFHVPLEKRLPMRVYLGQASGAVALVELLDQLEAQGLHSAMLAAASHNGLGCATILERK
ncbi:MAG TPA: hypothetical protein VMT46_14635 [Anaerolineaceae bacterium]|nr:hypothetical protein [Anaerolineaceae bacterium]